MKKQWYSRSRSSSAPREQVHDDGATLGCMSMVHYLIFAPGAGCVARPPTAVPDPAPPPPPPSNTRSSCGLEAPRNSLELDGQPLHDIQIGVQVEPAFDALARSSMRPKLTAPSSEAETPRTPSLVARLMGIDGLPEDSSPSPAPPVRKHPKPAENKKRVIPESMNRDQRRQPLRSLSCNAGEPWSVSLPDTPRASTSSEHPRLSLQVLKENVLDRAAQYMSMPTSPTSKKKTHRRREQAREIVRQAKETVTKRKSSPASSKATGASNKENTIPLILLLAEDKMVIEASERKPTTAPPPAAIADHMHHAPRLPLQPKPEPPPPSQRAMPSRPAPPPPPPLDPPQRAAPPPPPAVKCRRPDGCERFATRIKKPAATTTTTASQQCAAAPPPAASPVSSPVATSTSRPEEDAAEYRYLRAVLERGGFMRRGRPAKGQSAAAPVDPIVFHLLELELPADEAAAALGPLRHRWNRKLLFQLAQEILAEVLEGGAAAGGAALLGKVWRRVRSFPAAECRVVADIDELVGGDLEAARVRRLAWHPAVVAEGGHVADDVAERVLDALLGECAESLSVPSRAPAPRRR